MTINKVTGIIDPKYLDLLRLIDSGEYRLAYDGKLYGFKDWIEVYTFETSDNIGIFTSMHYKDFLRFQVSFQKEPDDETIDTVHVMIKEIIAREKKVSDIWLNNDNTNLVTALIERFNIPLNEVYMGRELMYLKEPQTFDIGPLKEVPYSDTILMDILNLLEDSFVRIARPNDFISHKEEYGKKFASVDHSRFTGFMLNDELIGMYFHHDGEIEYLGVKSKYQSKGYGRLILNHALQKIKEDSTNVPYLYCVDENERALKFYLREGFMIMAHSARL